MSSEESGFSLLQRSSSHYPQWGHSGPFSGWKGSPVIRARFPRDSKSTIKLRSWKLLQSSTRTRGIPEDNKLTLSLLKKSLNSSCQNFDIKKTRLTFFECFVIVVGWERHFVPVDMLNLSVMHLTGKRSIGTASIKSLVFSFYFHHTCPFYAQYKSPSITLFSFPSFLFSI